MRMTLLAAALIGAAVLAAAPARAQLQFTLNPASQTYSQGATATWSATITNIGATTLTLAGINFSGLPTGLTVDDTLYFTNFDNITLTTSGAGSSITANLFTSTASMALAPGTYNSTVTVTYTGGPTSPADANATFQSVITAAAVPEPSALGLLGLGGIGLVVRRRRR